MQPKLNEIFTLYPGYDGIVKKTSQATVPLSFSVEVPTWTVLVMSLFYGLISLLAFLGNSLVIYVVATSRRMQVTHTLSHSYRIVFKVTRD
jgi:hypothetical protein